MPSAEAASTTSPVLSEAMGAALQSLVAAQGAAAGRAAHACAGHFEEIANIMASKPSAFVGGGE